MEFFNHIHCKYTGIKGFLTVYNDGLRYRYMITEKAKHKAKVLIFWEKHGLEATLDAFPHKRSTLYLWRKQWIVGNKKIEALNEKSRSPKIKRKKLWPLEIIQEIKHIREIHPNLGEKKIYPLLLKFCLENHLPCPKPATIGRLIKDLGGLRLFPQKVTHFGKIKKVNRKKILRKPKDFKPQYPGHLVALDTVEKFVYGCRRYVITFEDIYTRFGFAWATKSHASQAAKEFFDLCRKVFPYPFEFQYVLTDNGSEFKKYFDEELKKLHMIHYHTYPKTPKMNAHLERFNRTIQDEFINYYSFFLLNTEEFNRKLVDYLVFYNTERVHCAFQNKMSPVQYMISYHRSVSDQNALESKIGCGHTSVLHFCFILL
jgi:transposase InsO family protein